MIKTKNRVLLPSGKSVVSIEEAARQIFQYGIKTTETTEKQVNFPIRENSDEKIGGKIFVPQGVDFERFLVYYGDKNEKIEATELDDTIPSPDTNFSEEEASELVKDIFNTKRDDTPDKEHEDRLFLELEYFFEQEGGTRLLHELRKLIERFKQDDVVWGGRGSSCASYVLYLLEVHDINPIKYDIPFYEFSKEFNK